MGIYFQEPQQYECSVCGAEGRPYSEPPATSISGYWHGVKCSKCGHKTRHYKQSIYEQEMGQNVVITFNRKQKF